MQRTKRLWITLSALLLLALAVVPAAAIHPDRWVHDTEADFAPGKSDQVVVTNLGDVKLASATSMLADLAELTQQVSIINDLQDLGGGVFIAAGPHGRILGWRNGQLSTQLELPDQQVFALDVSPDGFLLAAVSGTPSKLLELTPNGFVTRVELPAVRYIWDMQVIDGKVYLATGIDGRLLEVTLADLAPVKPDDDDVDAQREPNAAADNGQGKPEIDAAADADDAAVEADQAAAADAAEEAAIDWPAGVRVILKTRQANLLCLGKDQRNRLFVGTDTDGLIYRVTLGPKVDDQGRLVGDAFVLFDAPEPEIGALHVRADGTVFAGTADAAQASPGRLAQLGTQPAGRPDESATLPVEVPEAPPEPGDIPNVPPKPEPQEPGDKEPLEDQAKPKVQAAAPPIPPKPANKAHDQDAAPLDAATMTPADEDAIRNELRQRLLTALGDDAEPLQADDGPAQFGPPRMPSPSPSTGAPLRSGGGGNQPGNAIYHIDPLGLVNEVFRESVMILRILPDPADQDRLLVATGSEGQLYRLDPAAEETTILVALQPQQIPALIARADGRVLLGTANPASLVMLEKGFAKVGEFTSPPLDATQISLWGTLHVTAEMPPGTSMKVQTRSGNVGDPEGDGWAAWTDAGEINPDDAVAALSPRPLDVPSPPARFIQYRLVLLGNGALSPVTQKMELAYVLPNLKPVIQSVRATYAPAQPGGGGRGAPGVPAEEPQAATTLQIEWVASDPNNDQLNYTLEYQPAGSDKWLPLAQDIREATMAWATRRVPDGRYVLRLTASDSPDNPADMALKASRLSDPVVVDNTPPDIAIVKKALQNGTLTVNVVANDKLSTIKSLHYAVDSADDWQQVLPDDLIFDSTKEAATVKIADLSPGPHVVTLRAIDALGNAKYEALMIEVK